MPTDRKGLTIATGTDYMVVGTARAVGTNETLLLCGEDGQHALRCVNADVVPVDSCYVFASGTAPTDVFDGRLWLDTDHELLRIYDGGDWISASDHVLIEVRNGTGSDMAKGQPVYVASTHASGKPNVALADNDANGAMPAIGLLTTDLAAGAEGFVTAAGTLPHIDTSTFATGDALYVSSTAGQLTNSRPSSIAEKVQKVALVTRAHANGTLIVMGAGRTNDIPNGAATDSVLLDHVTNTGSTTSVTLQHGGQALGEQAVGIPIDRACKTGSAVVTWRADTAPAGTWTLTIKKKAAGSRTYQTAATMSVTVNNG